MIVSIKYEGVDKASYWLTGADDAQSTDRIKSFLSELYERAPSTPLFIKADKRLRYKVVKDVMLLCENAGFSNVALVAQAPQ